MKLLASLFCLLAASQAKIYYKEQFNDNAWSNRWMESTKWKAATEMGKWEQTAGLLFADAADKGLKTSEDSKFYGITSKMSESIDNKDKDLVLQFSVKFEKSPECGGAYIKLLPSNVDQESFGGESPYSVMFGPDVCGSGTRKTHIIFHYKGKNLLMKPNARVETDNLSHLYTLIVKPDNTYEFRLDNEVASHGSLLEDWDFLPPKKIDDPSAKKPEDWVDEEMMDDPEAKKPEGYDDIPETIADPEAKKPEDWDEEEDGEWEAPTKPNPEYKGPWKAPKVKNPNYKGPWEHPQIDNPEYIEDPMVHHVCHEDGCGAVGFELWQVKSGSLFDDILVTDSVEEAEAFAKETFFAKRDGEKKMKEEVEEKERKEREEREAKEKEEAAAKEGEEDESEEKKKKEEEEEEL